MTGGYNIGQKKKRLQTVSVAENKHEALKAALEKIEKDFGKNAVIKMSQNVQRDERAISTGSIGLDKALGVGGLPRGRIIEIYGPESSGKTTLALHAIASAQGKGGIAAFVDAEHALDPAYATALGLFFAITGDYREEMPLKPSLLSTRKSQMN